jgi:hypothetical protein
MPPPPPDYRAGGGCASGSAKGLISMADMQHMQTPSAAMTPTNFASDFGRGHRKEGSLNALDVSNGAFSSPPPTGV